MSVFSLICDRVIATWKLIWMGLWGFTNWLTGRMLISYVVTNIKEVFVINIQHFREILERFIINAFGFVFHNLFSFLNLFFLHWCEVFLVFYVELDIFRYLFSSFSRFFEYFIKSLRILFQQHLFAASYSIKGFDAFLSLNTCVRQCIKTKGCFASHQIFLLVGW